MSVKISVATVIWNPGDLLQRTLDSVAEQDYDNVEHVIVDGRSKDNTLVRLHQYQEQNSLRAKRREINMLSEPDNGLYDAMNKAINMATGDYLVFLNAGDKFHSVHTLSDVAACAAEHPAVIYGNTDIVDGEGTFLCKRHLQPPAELNWKSFRHGMLVCHQAFFARTDIAKKTPYNLKYRFSADFDWCIRIMKEGERLGLPMADAGIVVADYLNEGMTTKNHRKSLMERFRIMAHHYGLLSTAGRHLYFLWRSARH